MGRRRVKERTSSIMKERTLTELTAHEVLHGLTDALRAERQAVADYCAHAQACNDPKVREALETLGDVEREHATRLAARLGALGGDPASEEVTPLPISGSMTEWLAQDLAGEQWAIVEYARLVACIMDDSETVALLRELLLDEIRHAAWLKTTLNALGRAYSAAPTQGS